MTVKAKTFAHLYVGEPDAWDAEGMHMQRHTVLKTWCGYVGVGERHPLYGCDYNDELTYPLDVHGGLSYAGRAYWEQEKHSSSGRPTSNADLWWFGFDCAHADDLVPGAYFPDMDGTYRTFDYAQKQVFKLARQLVRSYRR